MEKEIDNENEDSSKAKFSRTISLLTVIISFLTLVISTSSIIYISHYNANEARELEEYKAKLNQSLNLSEFEINTFNKNHDFSLAANSGTVEFRNIGASKANNVNASIAIAYLDDSWSNIITEISDFRITTYPASLNIEFSEGNVGLNSRTTGQGYDNINNAYILHCSYLPQNSSLKVELNLPEGSEAYHGESVDVTIISDFDIDDHYIYDIVRNFLYDHFWIADFQVSVCSDNSTNICENYIKILACSWPEFFIESKGKIKQDFVYLGTLGFSYIYPIGTEPPEKHLTNLLIRITHDEESENGYRVVEIKSS